MASSSRGCTLPCSSRSRSSTSASSDDLSPDDAGSPSPGDLPPRRSARRGRTRGQAATSSPGSGARPAAHRVASPSAATSATSYPSRGLVASRQRLIRGGERIREPVQAPLAMSSDESSATDEGEGDNAEDRLTVAVPILRWRPTQNWLSYSLKADPIAGFVLPNRRGLIPVRSL